MRACVPQNVTKHGLQGNEYFDFLMDMITLGVDLTLEKLQRREFSDADIKEALLPLRQAMEHDHPILTSVSLVLQLFTFLLFKDRNAAFQFLCTLVDPPPTPLFLFGFQMQMQLL